MQRMRFVFVAVACLSAGPLFAQPAGTDGADATRFRPAEVFDLQWAADPQIAPAGDRVVYVRSFFDIMNDRTLSNLWIVGADGSGHRALTTGDERDASPRWSPSGDRLLYVSSREGGSEIWVRWMDTGQEAKLTRLTQSPGGIAWSPDGRWIAFSMFVPEQGESYAHMPQRPEGADWGKPWRVIDKLVYRINGRGYLEDGYQQLFVMSAEGGTPRQVTSGPFSSGGTPRWTPDGEYLIFSANRHEDSEYEPRNSEIYEVSIGDGTIRALTDRVGPDADPAVSPDGSRIAYVGYDDRYQAYQVLRLYVMNRDGSGARLLTADFDRDVVEPIWDSNGRGLSVLYDDEGETRIGYVTLDGTVTPLAGDVGGLSLGRPYSGGSYSISQNGRFAYTHTRPDHPADVAVGRRGRDPRRLTSLNDGLLGHKQLGSVEEIWYESSYDGRRVQGWIVKPPDFDPSGKYPLLLEIHGGPVANYGERFSAEIQLYAAAGYVVLYTNPRGSDSYGEEFGNLIYHAYPSHDYDDLMSGVDAVIEQGYIDEDQLYVTGGSGGGVLSAWIVGHTDRFRAAVVVKPVINFYSFVLTSDFSISFVKYWFSGPPWEHPEQYLALSPLTYVGNVTTPTMLMTGEVDYRTPISESEQFYEALMQRGIPTALVRVPDANHGIANRPSDLIEKVAHVLGWFERYSGTGDSE
jgi:dipeptidyl aminopeptidase/acylaminoacyl peptidase